MGRSILFVLIFLISFSSSVFCEMIWQEEKADHFVIYYSKETEVSWVKKVLLSAERYYDKIADQIGYSRYSKFWTWDQRVKIYVYPDQDTFIKETNQPDWSKGGAYHLPGILEQRVIISFKQEEGFLDGVLPHEISHLLLRDFFVGIEIPIWFDEGISQLQEKEKKQEADKNIRTYLLENEHLPFETLLTSDIREEKDPLKVALFYAQSVSILNYLISKYGAEDFTELCRYMREGNDFKTALQSAYASIFSSIEDLEKKWLSYMKNL